MASFNKVILIGNMVADPELKKTRSASGSSDVSVTSFRIAVGRKYIKQGESTSGAPQADFIDIVAWRNTAEFVTRFFTKGKPILVCGQLQTRSWTDSNGQKRYATEVVADEVSFVGNKSEDASQGRFDQTGAPSGSAPSYTQQTGFEELADDEDLPF